MIAGHFIEAVNESFLTTMPRLGTTKDDNDLVGTKRVSHGNPLISNLCKKLRSTPT